MVHMMPYIGYKPSILESIRSLLYLLIQFWVLNNIRENDSQKKSSLSPGFKTPDPKLMNRKFLYISFDVNISIFVVLIFYMIFVFLIKSEPIENFNYILEKFWKNKQNLWLKHQLLIKLMENLISKYWMKKFLYLFRDEMSGNKKMSPILIIQFNRNRFLENQNQIPKYYTF